MERYYKLILINDASRGLPVYDVTEDASLLFIACAPLLVARNQ